MSRIVILECGAQYTKVIDRRVREREVRSDVLRLDTPAAAIGGCDGIIISGGPHSVYEAKIPFDPGIFALGVPVLGICYGMQLICQHFGGEVAPIPSQEYGETWVEVDTGSELFYGLEPRQIVLMSHGDSVLRLPPGFDVIARSPACVAGIKHRDLPIYGLQFHPEVDLTINGGRMFDNFLFRVCRCPRDFTLESRLEEAVRRVREQVGGRKVLILVSGGVDSCVSYVILNRALRPDQVIALHIDNGFMRKGESAEVMESLTRLGFGNLEFIDAGAGFMKATMEWDGKTIGPLEQASDPEHKRMLIGCHFLEVVREFLARRRLDLDETFLAQGTLRPDLIESGNPEVSGFASRIKTHHNDVDIIREQRRKNLIVETNRDLHKDEVRRLARELGLPEAIASRQPFPGPGLAIRVLNRGAPPPPTYPSLAREFRRAAQEQGLDAVLTPVETVGVQGDSRTYRHLALLYPGPSLPLQDWDGVRAAAKRLVDGVPYLNRVAVVLSGHRSSQELRTFCSRLDRDSVELCREVDDFVVSACTRHGVARAASQILAVLVPLHAAPEPRFSVGLRVFMTNDYMTGYPAPLGPVIPWECVDEIAEWVRRHPRLDLLVYDATSKPPATTEWQ
ncbi:MAG: glutamine-hydrolyzing GMP synthase [Acetobacteraceae bacterium]|nr:glutamine-hydrolyzing GMP synthase [Acetobacteraceae bacterium]